MDSVCTKLLTGQHCHKIMLVAEEDKQKREHAGTPIEKLLELGLRT